MAKPRALKNRLQGPELRAFRTKVSQLKKLGGVSKRTDARKQRPTRYMVDKVKRLEPVLSGEAVLVARKKLRPDILADFERTHNRVGGTVMIRKAPAEKLHMRKGLPEFDRLIADTGERRVVQKRIPLPIDVHNFSDFIADLRRNPEKWAAKRGPYPPWLFGFRIGKGYSNQLFVEPELLADALEAYSDADDGWFDDEFDSFELMAIDQHRYGTWGNPNKKRRPGKRGQRRPPHPGKLADLAAAKRAQRAKMSDSKVEQVRARNAAAMAKRRADGKYREAEKVRDKASHALMRRAMGMKERKPK